MNRIVVPSNMALRAVEEDDHPWLVNLHNDEEVLKNLNDSPITIGSHLAWWARVSKDPHEKRLIFTVDGERVGFTKFYSIDHRNSRCMLGADIDPAFRGRGHAKYMWTLMLQVVFDELQLHRAGLRTAEYNAVGRRVYTKLGFKEEGRLRKAIHFQGVRYDDLCMSILKPEWDER